MALKTIQETRPPPARIQYQTAACVMRCAGFDSGIERLPGPSRAIPLRPGDVVRMEVREQPAGRRASRSGGRADEWDCPDRARPKRRKPRC